MEENQEEKREEIVEIEENTALLKHDHVTYTKNNIPLEYCIAIYIGNKYAYEIEETRIK